MSTLFVGDSLFKYLQVDNADVRSLSGGKTEDLLPLMRDVSDFDNLVVHVGTNDLARRSVVETLDGFEDMLSVIRTRAPSVRIFVSNVLPRSFNDFPGAVNSSGRIDGFNVRAANLNAELRKLEDVQVIDHPEFGSSRMDVRRHLLSRDGLHLSPSGLRVLREDLTAAVRRHGGTGGKPAPADAPQDRYIDPSFSVEDFPPLPVAISTTHSHTQVTVTPVDVPTPSHTSRDVTSTSHNSQATIAPKSSETLTSPKQSNIISSESKSSETLADKCCNGKEDSKMEINTTSETLVTKCCDENVDSKFDQNSENSHSHDNGKRMFGGGIFRLGNSYKNFEEFLKHFEIWKEETMSPMKVADSKKNEDNEEFPYRYINYVCKHFGKPRVRSESTRPNLKAGHWITVSTKNCKPNEINIFDSSNPLSVHYDIRHQICSIMRVQGRSLKLRVKDMHKQIGVYDCGLFAIAYAVSLLFNENPEHIVFDQKKLREHLLNCIERNEFTPFPSTNTRTSSHYIKEIDLYCSCRCPHDITNQHMIQCSKCKEWFHFKCLDASFEDLEKITTDDSNPPFFCSEPCKKRANKKFSCI